MIPVTFSIPTTPTATTVSAFLIDDVPNWETPVSVEASIPSSYERGLTGKETRRQTGDTLRLSLKFTSLLTSPEQITNLRNSLQSLAQQPVLCPFWPGGFEPGTMPTATSQLYVLLDGITAPSIQPASALGSGFGRFAYPLLVGILPEIPDPPLTTSTVASVEYSFSECFAEDFIEPDNANLLATYFLTPPSFTPPTGIEAAIGVCPLFPFATNWVSAPKSGTAEFDIDRQQIGQSRALSQIYYTQPNRRRVQQDLLLQNTDPLNLLSFFVSMGGETQSFWLPANLKEAFLTENVAATDSVLNVDNPSALDTNTFICLNNGTTRLPLIVSSVSDSQWLLTGEVGQAFTSWDTSIESLVLARFDALKLTLSFITATCAKVSIKFKELPWETAAVSGEVIGTTMGPLPTTAMLYVFTLTTPGANVVSYYTNFERNLTDGNGNVYIAAPIENEDITDSPSLERQNVTVKTRNFPGNPLALLIPFQLEFPLEIAISEGNVSGNNVSIISCYFSGEVGDVSMDGPLLSATCMSLNWMFDRTAARRLYQNNDNWNLFEAANGLNPPDWEWLATVVNVPDSTTVTINITGANNTVLNGGTQLVANFFSAGYVQITSATTAVSQYRMVSSSTGLATDTFTGTINLYLSSPLTTTPVMGDTVVVFAGYDGQYETAINTFKNGANFGGFPFIPVGNPFVMKITENPGGGKK